MPRWQGRSIAATSALGFALLAGAGITAGTAAEAPATGSPAPAPPPSIDPSTPRTIFENTNPPSEPHLAGFPGIVDAGQVDEHGRRTHDFHVSFNAGQDVVGDIVLGHLHSSDGERFTEYTADPELDVHNAVRRTDPQRTLIAPGYEPIFDNGSPPYEDVDADRQFPLFRYVDGTWLRSAEPATVTTDEPVAVARLHQGVTTLPDGRLIAPLYGSTPDGRSYVYVVASTDGIDWRQIGTVATGPAGRWTESHLVRLPNGTLAAAIRYGNPQSGHLDLYLARARTPDGSGSWHEPVPIAQQAGAAPRLQQLANGTLALLSGRFDNQVRVSFDGLGRTWTDADTLYANYSVGAEQGRDRELGSSGYMGVVATGPGELLVLGDNCAGHWGCPDTVDEFTVDDRKTLWAADIGVDPGLGHRIDLLSGFREGSVRFVDTEPARYARGQLSLLPYAFDGVTSPASSLVTADRTVTLDLGRPRPLTAVVAHTDVVGSQPVRIETSTDGQRWRRLPAEPAGATYRLPRPVAARYVRLTDPNAPTPETADWSFLNDLQIYVTERR